MIFITYKPVFQEELEFVDFMTSMFLQEYNWAMTHTVQLPDDRENKTKCQHLYFCVCLCDPYQTAWVVLLLFSSFSIVFHCFSQFLSPVLHHIVSLVWQELLWLPGQNPSWSFARRATSCNNASRANRNTTDAVQSYNKLS